MEAADSIRDKWPALRYTAPRYALVGATCAALTLTLIFWLKSAFDVADAAANALGYAAGLACSYILNRHWTFRHHGEATSALVRFLAVFAFAYALNLLAVLLLIRGGLDAYAAHVLGVPVYTLVSYAGLRWFVFTPGASRDRDLAWGWAAAALLVALLSLAHRLGDHPIDLWDESRVANNAIEMARNGYSLVTTFDGVTDHWNTKPPLVVWAMAASIRLFGAAEWVVRLPSVLAALGTVALLLAFCQARLRHPLVGATSVLLLLATGGYMLRHGARSGDYDAVLTLCTTGYLMAGYLCVHGRTQHRKRWLYACAAGIALAFMAKSIQGLIFLPVLLAWAAAHRPLRLLLRTPAFAAAAIGLLAVVVGYHLAREHVDPGYFAMVQANDLQGRYTTVLDRHDGGVAWYLMQVERSPWLLPGLAAAAWLAWQGQDEERQLARYLGVLSAFYLAVISFAQTKLVWYPMPLYPLVALLTALALHRLVGLAAQREAWPAATVQRLVGWACAGLAALVLANGLTAAERWARHDTLDERDHYSVFLRGPALRGLPPMQIAVLHPGYPNAHDAYYTAPTLFYVNTLRHEGWRVQVQAPDAPVAAGTDAVVACGSSRERLPSSLRISWLVTEGTCGLYRWPAL